MSDLSDEARAEKHAYYGNDLLEKPRTRYFLNLDSPRQYVFRVTVELATRDRAYDEYVAQGKLREMTYQEYREWNAEHRRTHGHQWLVYLDAANNQKLLTWAKANSMTPQDAAAYMVRAYLRVAERAANEAQDTEQA